MNLYVENFCSCAKLLMKRFNIVHEANVLYDNGKIYKNFDAILNFDGSGDSAIKKSIEMITRYHLIPILGMDRMTKLEQHMFLKDAGVNTPITYDYVSKGRKGLEDIENLLHDVSGDTIIILKPYFGARGIGQVIMKRSELYDKLYKLMNGEKEVIDEIKVDNGNNEEHGGYIKGHINAGNYIIQLYEENIHKEYRILCFYDNEPIIMERVKDGKTWQSNMGANPGNTAKYVGENLANIIGIKNAKTVFELFDRINVPFLAIDIYVDRDKNMGVFEFQMEFGYDENYPANLLYKYINSSVNRMIIKIKQS